MTVTAKLSKKFYDRFGDDIANEFVNWFNNVDATHRTDLLRLNDTNLVVFDAKLEQRLAEQDARWDKRFAAIDQRFADFEAKLEKRLSDFKGDLLKWIVGLWMTTMLGIVGLFVAVLQLR